MLAPAILQDVALKFSLSFLSLFQGLHFVLTRSFSFPARDELPQDLNSWRTTPYDENAPIYAKIWKKLEPVFQHQGLTLWRRCNELNQSSDGPPAPSNYAFVPFNFPNGIHALTDFGVFNGLHHAARKGGRHYVVRVMSVRGEGSTSLGILRLLSTTSPDNLLSNNHILPMEMEIVYQDIVFGVFPFLGATLRGSMFPLFQECTVEDSAYMVMQALEAVIYIHRKNIAHRDLFLDNFMVEWSPQSILGQNWTRPRVYLIDFETAIHFSDDVNPSERLTSGLPLPGDDYSRQRPPELLASDMYCPFRLDMWQFGFQLMQIFSKTGIDEMDTLWPPLMAENPADRPTAQEVFQKLGDFISSVPPKHLQRAYTCDPIPSKWNPVDV